MTQHIKCPEEVRMEAIERTLRRNPVFYMSQAYFFMGTPDSYISWDIEKCEGEIVVYEPS